MANKISSARDKCVFLINLTISRSVLGSSLLGQLGWNYRGLILPLRVTNSNRCIAQAIKTSLLQGCDWHPSPPVTGALSLPGGYYPALWAFLGSEPDTPAVSSRTYWGAVTCDTFDQERSTGQQGLLVVAAPSPHSHLAPVECGLCNS